RLIIVELCISPFPEQCEYFLQKGILFFVCWQVAEYCLEMHCRFIPNTTKFICDSGFDELVSVLKHLIAQRQAEVLGCTGSKDIENLLHDGLWIRVNQTWRHSYQVCVAFTKGVAFLTRCSGTVLAA